MIESLNIALIFNDRDAADIAAYSQALAPHINSDYIIGVNSHPHVTLLQVGSDLETLIAAVRAVGADTGPHTVTATNTYCHAGSGGLSWYGLAVHVPPSLAALPTALWEKLGRPEIHNPIGKDYFPHITTGHGVGVEAGQMPDALGLYRDYTVRLVIGTSGPRYQLEDIVYQL